jgi:hypothetical protein
MAALVCSIFDSCSLWPLSSWPGLFMNGSAAILLVAGQIEASLDRISLNLRLLFLNTLAANLAARKLGLTKGSAVFAKAKMIMKHCPKCGSSRIRHGYSSDSLAMRFIGLRELLCDACNLRFRGFVLPGTMPASHRGKQQDNGREIENQNGNGRTRELNPNSTRRCPMCASEKIHRSHRRNIFEHLASTVSIYPHRCDDCHSRFLARRRKL